MDMINNQIKYKLINSKHKWMINYYDEIENPNILVIHHMNWIEIIHLFTSKRLTQLTLSKSTEEVKNSYSDINGNDSVDNVYMNSLIEQKNWIDLINDFTCFVSESDIKTYKHLFQVNICKKRIQFYKKEKEVMKSIEVLPSLLIPNNKVWHDGRSWFNVIVLNSNCLMTWVNSECNLL